MSPHVSASSFGYLIPLAPANDKNDMSPLQDSMTQLLAIPGSFGRAVLLEPYAKKRCPNCRKTKEDEDGKKDCGGGLCQFCQSLQSLAKFIPRKDFLNFSPPGSSEEQEMQSLVLTFPTKNTAKLVSVSSAALEHNVTVSEQKTGDGIKVSDGDVVSICWYQKSNTNPPSKGLRPLIRYRVYKCEEIANSDSAADDSETVQKKVVDNHSRNDDHKVKPNDDTNEKNEGNEGLKFHLKDENSKRVEVGKSNGCNENGSQESSEEELEESAPLSLPSNFMASYSKSFSFDSQLQSTSPPKVIINAAVGSSASSLKRKTPPQTEDATFFSFTTTKTPKKSNVITHVGGEESAVRTMPLTSLSYNELVQLRDQSTTSSSSSLRHNVLSLALALTSNASAYDSNFMNGIKDFHTKQTGKEASIKKDNASKSSRDTNADTGQWMPRLLHGTEVILNKKSHDNK